ncbi:methyltransferase [Sphingomonas antarctica]|uniref:methyltransferase n=1 Tax=Sphingomonas antarctica TaxID=2040274 RepID=UPI0039E793C5
MFGWSLPFGERLLPADLLEPLRASGGLEDVFGAFRAKLRVSSVDGRLYVHSSFPTVAADAVFLGPDSYRFARLIAAELSRQPLAKTARVVDIGTGAGVGALTVGGLAPNAKLLGTDINADALRLASVNATAAGMDLQVIQTSALDGIDGTFDLILLNPPFIADDGDRVYRDGGRRHGGQLSLDLAKAALARLAPGGRLILYTGSAIIKGQDRLHQTLARLIENGCRLEYNELDPDIFGEELSEPAYSEVDRIALVSAIFRCPV